jgi:hypothetical protein
MSFYLWSVTTAWAVPIPPGASDRWASRNRVQALGGALAVLSPPAKGTTIRVQLPFDND